jgi:hypothetical protein
VCYDEEHEMEGSTKLIIGIAVIVLIGLPLMGQLAKKPAATAPASAPQSSTQSPAQAPQQPEAPPPPPPPPPGPPPPMDLANTAWTINTAEYGDVTVELSAGGQGVANSPQLPMPIQGTWVQRGKSLTFSVMGRNITAQLNGDQLMANGRVAERVR